MRKVLIYSLLLVAGLLVSQLAPLTGWLAHMVTLATMVALGFIMIHVGYEFELDKTRPLSYAWDYVVAASAATLPWIFCALYFVYAMTPRSLWGHYDLWKEAALKGLFASPTSAGVLFSMLAAAGLGATWMFGKARVLAVFDDLNTILLLIPLKIMLVGVHWQLLIVVAILVALLSLAWKYLHVVRLPVSWPFVFSYSLMIAGVCEGILLLSKSIDSNVPIQIEVLLPAFVLGCILARPAGHDPHVDDAVPGHEVGPESASEQRVATIVSGIFMVLVGLSMPAMFGGASDHVVPNTAVQYDGAPVEDVVKMHTFPGWGLIMLHVAIITLLSNLGKMLPAICYRREASMRERLALSVAMFPRGEVGAGVLVISLSYGMGGPTLTVAVLSLALNLLATGGFIVIVKKLLANGETNNRSAEADPACTL